MTKQGPMRRYFRFRKEFFRWSHHHRTAAASSPTSYDCMSSYEEIDPLAPDSSSQSRIIQPPLQQLLFPRSRTQMGFMPLTSPSSRRNSSYRRRESSRHRSQALLERCNTPAHSWEKFRKSEEELREIKNKKVRLFYENQVRTLRVRGLTCRIV